MHTLISRVRDPKSWFAFILVFIAIPGGYQFSIALEASIIWPAVGFTFGFLVVDWRRFFLPTLFAVFTGYFTTMVFMFDYAGADLLARTFVFTASLHIPAFFGAYFLSRFLEERIISLVNFFLFIVTAIVVAAFNTLPAIAFLFLIGAIEQADIFNVSLVWALGNYFALIIFGLSLWISMWRDVLPKNFKAAVPELIFYGSFVVLSIAIFSGLIGFINYANHKIIFFPLAIVVAFYLPYRAFYIATLFYLLSMFLFPAEVIVLDLFYYLFDVNLFLLIILITIISLKWVLDYIEQEQDELNLTSKRLYQLIDSMEMLFNLSTQISTLEDRAEEKHAANIFRMIFGLFDRFDYGSCTVVTPDRVRFIDTIGHDKDYLNTLFNKPSKWIGNLKRPRIYKDAEANLKAELGPTYADYARKNPAIKESVLMSVRLDEKLICEMSFDIAEKSPRKISKNILQYFDSIHILLNSFYDARMMAGENDKSKRSMIQALLKTVGLYSKDAEKHAEDVAEIASALAEAFELDKSVVTELYWAGIVHDIGMIGVDKHIVNKKGVLTQAEYEQVKTHVIHGAKILAQTSHLRKITAVVRHHHEHYDWMGYPDGLKGDELLLETSILALSEAVAAMVRDYAYAAKLTEDAIIMELKDKSGSQFHPLVVDKMIVLIEQGILKPHYQ